ncbi:MAG: hypothetical protein QXF82_03075 [Nitrososphaeria archaeon]
MNLEEEIQKRMKELEERMKSTSNQKEYLALLRMYNKLLWELTQLTHSKTEKKKEKESIPENAKFELHDDKGWYYLVYYPREGRDEASH